VTDQHLFIDGTWVTTPGSFEVTDPWDGSIVGRAADGDQATATRAVDAAAKAADQPMPAHERAAVLRRAAALVAERAEEFAQTIRAEAGKPITAARAETTRAIDTLHLSAEAARNLAGVTVPMDAVSAGTGLIAFETPQPRGPVAAITPFNFPLNLVCHKVGPAIAAGCPIVLKPSEKTPLTAGLLAQVFQDAALPPGMLNLITGDPAAIVSTLLDDERIAVLTFTGSAAIGWELKARSPRKHHVLELGSNTAMVVARDADLTQAVNAAVTSSFTYSGQACISLQRIYVQEQVADDFIQRLGNAAAGLPTGDPHDERTVVGPMISNQARDRVVSWIQAAVDDGATLHTGGDLKDGVLRPTVLGNVPATSPVVCDEVFGPVVSINRFSELHEAIELVNDSRFGLNTAIYTADLTTAMTYANRAETGAVLINVPPAFRSDHMPYGGVKESGQGREGVPYAVRELTEPKVVILAAPA
jgi:acyl-CoA reductase-like NAD-dependent aldehyde dehydrogenase